jgi:hypothetical protein
MDAGPAYNNALRGNAFRGRGHREKFGSSRRAIRAERSQSLPRGLPNFLL